MHKNIGCLSFIVTFLTMAFFLISIFGGFFAVLSRFNTRAEIHSVEQLRMDLHRSPKDQRHMILSMVMQVNGDIAARKKMNEYLLTDWLISDLWNEVEPINTSN